MKKSQLNAKNRITAVAALSVPVLRYSSGVIKLVIENTRTAAHSRCYNALTRRLHCRRESEMSHQTDEALVQFLWCEVCTEVDFILCNIV